VAKPGPRVSPAGRDVQGLSKGAKETKSPFFVRSFVCRWSVSAYPARLLFASIRTDLSPNRVESLTIALEISLRIQRLQVCATTLNFRNY
jgi:hypothetical protein